ncbi:MAG: N-acetylglucosamine-6-phosphate deacetylase [Candidatus Epulonipiscioides saccharophilum]|nr:MAG: N-acetylglucosamine-6-phosphate deacetylase [Epulopiscium sp. AS2M-Bin001]
MKYIKNGKIILDNKIITDKVLIFSDKIEKIVKPKLSELNDLEEIDAMGNFVSPGFIDIHIHGYNHNDFMDCNLDGLRQIARDITFNGVTSFLPTTMSMPKDIIQNALDIAKIVSQDPITNQAQVLGAHLEGPYLNKLYAGAQNPDNIIIPDAEEIDFVQRNSDIIKLLTLAPEIENALTFIKKIKRTTDIALSMGHTAASYKQAMAGIVSGISSTSHLFNAMSGLHHRDPGAVGAALKFNIFCELICDNIHINPAIMEFIVKLKSLDKIILVTDAMSAAGCSGGLYNLGGLPVIVKNQEARLENGALAGSVLKLNDALYNLIHHSELPIELAINFVTKNPAKLIGVDSFKGSLAIGMDADINIFDKDINMLHTFVKGNLC